MYCARISLPLPVGPFTKTFTFDFATFRLSVRRSIERGSAAMVLSPSVMKLTARFSKNCFSRECSVLGRAIRSKAPFIERSTENDFAFSSIIARDLAPRLLISSTTFFRPPISFSKAKLKIAFTF